jgi:hypothetical protein
MSECKENEVGTMAALSKKIDDQSRFTRMLVVVCCLAVLASMFYSLTSLVGLLPELTLARIMGNLDSVHNEWRALEKLSTSKK